MCVGDGDVCAMVAFAYIINGRKLRRVPDDGPAELFIRGAVTVCRYLNKRRRII